MIQVRCRKENITIRQQAKDNNLLGMNKVLSGLYNGKTKQKLL